MRHTDELRPHLTDARRNANATYLRRRARSAADMLLDIDPSHWDEHTRKVLLHTLPRLARIEPWEIRDLESERPSALTPLRVQQENGCPDCWQDHGALHTESCRVAIELRKRTERHGRPERCEHGYAPVVCGQCADRLDSEPDGPDNIAAR